MCHIWSWRKGTEIIDLCCKNALLGQRFPRKAGMWSRRTILCKLLQMWAEMLNEAVHTKNRRLNFRQVWEWKKKKKYFAVEMQRYIGANGKDEKTHQPEFRTDLHMFSVNTNSPLSPIQGKYSSTLGLQRGWALHNKPTHTPHVLHGNTTWPSSDNRSGNECNSPWCLCFKLLNTSWAKAIRA